MTADTSAWRSPRNLPWLEILLILSIITLILQLIGPSLIQWWQLPRPGSVGIDYLASEFFQDNLASCLGSAYVGYLLTRYAQAEAWPLVVYLHGTVVANFVECACHNYRIDCERIYLMGYCMGGYGTRMRPLQGSPRNGGSFVMAL